MIITTSVITTFTKLLHPAASNSRRPRVLSVFPASLSSSSWPHTTRGPASLRSPAWSHSCGGDDGSSSKQQEQQHLYLDFPLPSVRVLFLILVDLCRRTGGLPHSLPSSQVGTGNIIIRLHYIDGNYTVLPEVVEASLGPHMQNMPRPRGADAAGLLLRELELHPPSEEWHRRNMFGGPWSDPEDLGPLDNLPKAKLSGSEPSVPILGEGNNYPGSPCLWPRKRRLSERDAAFGLKTSVGLGSYLGIMGSRRDVVTAVWKTGLDGVWYKCIRCLRQTCAFAQPGAPTTANEREAWWISRWAHGCPMCGGTWVRVV